MRPATSTTRSLPTGEAETRGQDIYGRRTFANAPRALWTPAGWRLGTEIWTRGRDGWDSDSDFAGYDPTTYPTYAECQAAIHASLNMRVAA